MDYRYWNEIGPTKSFAHPIDVETLKRWVQPDSRILDYGCGYGRAVSILAAAGCAFRDVVKVNVFLTDVGDCPGVNPVPQEMFGHARPASTLVEVRALAVPGARIEVDAVAVVP